MRCTVPLDSLEDHFEFEPMLQRDRHEEIYQDTIAMPTGY